MADAVNGRMRRIAGGATLARSAALVVLGALAVHQLRYLLAFGGDAHRMQLAEGHAYLEALLPLVVGAAVAVAAAAVVGRVVAAPADAPMRVRRAASHAVAIFAVFASQELVEGVVGAGHPGGLAGIFGAGGWLALPLSAAFGVLSAAIARLLDRVEDAFRPASRAVRSQRRQSPSRWIAFQLRRVPLAARALAFGLARRPPPPAPAR